MAKKDSSEIDNTLIGKFLEASNELNDLIRTRKPIIYIESNESENTIKGIVNNICETGTHNKKYKRQLFAWDCVTGLSGVERINGSIQTTVLNDQVKNPAQILDHVIADQKSGDACFVLFEFHHYLEDPNIQRRLRNFVEGPAKIKKSLIFVCPRNRGMARDGKKLPMELENIVHVFDWPLPDGKFLRHQLESNFIPTTNEIFREKNPPLPPVDLDEKQIDALVDSLKGLTFAEVDSAICTSIVKTQSLSPEVIIRSKKQIIKKSGLVEYIEPKGEHLSDIGGVDVLKEWLTQRKPILSEDAAKFGCDMPNGMMLLGPWGTGKSSIAKAIINEWGLPGLRIDAAKIMDSFVGSSERNAAEALKVADSVAPCVLWWDEVDDLFSGSASSSVSDGGTTSRVIGTISTWMSEHENLVFNIFTANDISNRPPKLFRKGRLDEIFIIDLPTEKERLSIFNIHIDARRHDGYSKERKIDLAKLASFTRMFSGAEIREAVNSGFIKAYNDGKREIKTSDILDSIKNTVPLSCTMKEDLSRLRKWQEGRAVKASSFDPEDLVEYSEYKKGIASAETGQTNSMVGTLDI